MAKQPTVKDNEKRKSEAIAKQKAKANVAAQKAAREAELNKPLAPGDAPQGEAASPATEPVVPAEAQENGQDVGLSGDARIAHLEESLKEYKERIGALEQKVKKAERDLKKAGVKVEDGTYAGNIDNLGTIDDIK